MMGGLQEFGVGPADGAVAATPGDCDFAGRARFGLEIFEEGLAGHGAFSVAYSWTVWEWRSGYNRGLWESKEFVARSEWRARGKESAGRRRYGIAAARAIGVRSLGRLCRVAEKTKAWTEELPVSGIDEMRKSDELSRRKFLENGVAGVALGAAALAIPGLLAAGLRGAGGQEVKAFELDEITVAELQDGMKAGKFTARAIVQKYLERIEAIDKRGPALNSVIELNPDALAIADAMDAERKAKGPRGPMHGVPVLIKDNIGTADRMMTTAGSLALLGFTPAKDSGVAQRLRESGRRDSGQDEPERVGQFPVEPFFERMERARRADSQSLFTRSQSVRIEFRLGSGGRCESLRGDGGLGDGRLDCVSCIGERSGGHQADAGTGEPVGNYSHRA